jgi:hypothetical protein
VNVPGIKGRANGKEKGERRKEKDGHSNNPL